MRLWPVALMALAMTTSAHAATDEGSAWRVGLGMSKVTIENDDVDFDDDTTGFEVYGGWELNRYLAVEAGYMDLGKAKEDRGISAGDVVDTYAFYASVLGSLWINDYASLFARAGILRWDGDATIDGDKFSVDGNDPYYGVGVAGLLDGALLRLEYRMGELDDVDLSLVTLNVAWRF